MVTFAVSTYPSAADYDVRVVRVKLDAENSAAVAGPLRQTRFQLRHQLLRRVRYVSAGRCNAVVVVLIVLKSASSIQYRPPPKVIRFPPFLLWGPLVLFFLLYIYFFLIFLIFLILLFFLGVCL